MNRHAESLARRVTSADLLHYIRALSREVRWSSGPSDDCRDEHVLHALADRLRVAIAVGCPLDIAVVLGCAAEMSVFPLTSVLEQCSAAMLATKQPALCGVVWAIRHRQARTRARARTLLI
ncbi:hypothetical protein FCJ59_09470 [Cupriavidus basilensis]|nr:hypothetical protein [Cupriavidus basilensis]